MGSLCSYVFKTFWLSPLSSWRRACNSITAMRVCIGGCRKRVKNHIYCADGQTFIPLLSLPVKQSVRLEASLVMSTQRYASITSSPTVMQKESFVAVKLHFSDARERRALTKDIHQTTLNLFFFAPSLHVSSFIAFLPFPQEKK